MLQSKTLLIMQGNIINNYSEVMSKDRDGW